MLKLSVGFLQILEIWGFFKKKMLQEILLHGLREASGGSGYRNSDLRTLRGFGRESPLVFMRAEMVFMNFLNES